MAIKSTDTKARLKHREAKLKDAKEYLKSSKAILAKETTYEGKKQWEAQVRADKKEVDARQAAVNRLKR